MKQIPLTKGYQAIVDETSYTQLSQYKWQYDCGYASRRVWDKEAKKYYKQYMHKLIQLSPKGLVVDHINQNKLDNRKVNLRCVTVSQNITNAKKFKGEHSSKYRGVSFYTKLGKWVARTMVNHKSIHLGVFLTEDDAYNAYQTFTQKRLNHST